METDHQPVGYSYHFNFLYWLIWTCLSFSRQAHEGNWNKKSAWGARNPYCSNLVKRFSEIGDFVGAYCNAPGLVGHAALAGQLSLSYRDEGLDICAGYFADPVHCFDYGGLSGH